ncbi:MAG: hypothetical protein QM723_19650 [Myxococcaceae bacterium]
MTRLTLAVALALLPGCNCGKVTKTPDGPLQVQPASLDFGTLYVGASKTLPVHVVNPNLTATMFHTDPPAPFGPPMELAISGGGDINVDVTFTPTAAGTFNGTVKFETTSVALTGVALAPLDCGMPDICHTRTFDPDAGTCSDEVSDDGTDCTAGFACFATAHCQQGQCLGTTTTCDDHSLCTTDVCGSLGCGHVDNTASCPQPADPCQIPTCEPATGCGVGPAPDGTECGARDCTTAHVCVSGACQVRPAPQTLGCVDLVAGQPGGFGWADGIGTNGRLSYSVSAVARDSLGNLWLTDQVNGVLRKVTPAGALITVAGKLKHQDFVDGFGSGAQFQGLHDVQVDIDGTLLVADQHAIRRVTPQGLVTTFVGNFDAGTQDGIGAAAGFENVLSISVSPDGTVWAVDDQNPGQLRRISRQGEVTTVGAPFTLYGGHADVLGVAGGALIARGDVFEIAEDGGVTAVLPDAGFWQVLAHTLDGGIAMLSWDITHRPLSLLEADGGVTEVLPDAQFAGEFAQYDATRWALVLQGRIVLTDGVTTTVLAGAADPRNPSNGPVATAGLSNVHGVGAHSDGGVVFCDDFGLRTVGGGNVSAFVPGATCDDLAVLPDDRTVTTQNLMLDLTTSPFSGFFASALTADGFDVTFLGSGTADIGLFTGSVLDGGVTLVAESNITGMGPIDFSANDVVLDGDGGYWVTANDALEHLDPAGNTVQTISTGLSLIGLQRDPLGNLWTLDNAGFQLLKVTPAGVVTPIAQLADQPRQLALEPGGTVLVTVPEAILRVHP